MTEAIALPSELIQDGKIEFKNLDQYLAMVDKYVAYGNNFVVTEETMKGAKDEKALINKIIKGSVSWRSDTEKNILSTFIPVKEQMMNAEKKLKAAGNNIKVQLDKYDEELKEKWRANITLYIESQYQDTPYEPRVSIDEKWLYKKNFNGLEPKDSFIDNELTPAIMTDKANQKTEQNEVNMVKEFASQLNVNPAPYIKQLDSHSLPDVIEGMKFDVRMANQQQEAQEAGQRAERERAISQAQTKQVDEETGEVIKPVEERYDRSFKVFACTRDELQEIADFLNGKGIQFQGTSEG